MSRQWFYRESDGAEYGPCSSVQLRDMVRLGRVDRGTPVRTDASRGWIRADQVKGLFLDSAPGPATDAKRGPLPEEFTFPNNLTPGGGTRGHPLTSSDDLEALLDAWPNLRNLGPTATRAAHGLARGKSLVLRLMTDPRDAFGQAPNESTLTFAIAMIIATSLLYVMMWLPFLYKIESARSSMMGAMSRFSPAVPQFPPGISMPKRPRGFSAPPNDAVPAPVESPSALPSRMLARLWEIGPGLLLAASVSLAAIGFLGTVAMLTMASEQRPQPIRRGLTALGLSLTPLVCLLVLSLLMSLVATEVSLFCAYLGVFVSALYYHEALQVIGRIPLGRTLYGIPVIFAAGAYLLLRCSAGVGVNLMMGGMPF